MPVNSAPARHRGTSRLRRFCDGLSAGDRLRRHMMKTGMTLAGQRLWSSAEIGVLVRFYPDYRRICAALSRRSLRAIRSKAARLRITRPLRIWSDHDLTHLKVHYRRGTPMREILTLFPGKTAKQIWRRAAYSGWRRPRMPPKLRNIEPYDAVRTRAFALRLTMRDLAFLSRTRTYFLRQPSRANWRKIDKAASMLDGHMSIVWEAHEKTP